MKVLKYVLYAVASLVIVIGAVLAYVAATFDPNQYKPQIVKAVKDRTQRTLRLDGDIKLSLFPSIGAKVARAGLSERASDKEFAAVEEVRVALKLMPLFSKQAVVDAVEVKGLRANLVRFKDGKTNADDLGGAPDKTAPAPKGAEAEFKVDIDHVLIEDAAITFTDQAAGAKYVLNKLNLKTGRIASGVPTSVELSVHVQGDKPRINLQTALKARLLYDLEQQRYALEGLDLNAKGDAADFSNLVATARGDLDVRPAAKELFASKLALSVSGKQAGGEVNVKLDAPKLAITKDKVSGEKLVLDATLSQAKSKLVARLDIPGVEGNAKAFRAGSMTASVDLQQEGSAVKAKISSPLAGSVEAERIELPKLAASIHVSNPKLPKSPIDAAITGAAVVDLAKQNANLTFATKLDDSNISGRAGLAKFAPPFYTFDLAIDQLDADRYLPKTDPKAKQPEQPFDFSALKGLNASGSVKIGSLKLANVKASNVRLDIKANGGRVDVSPLSASLYQGTLNGALAVNAAPATPTFAVKQNLNGVSVGPLLRDLADNDSLEGRGNVNMDVTAQGNTVTAIKKALNGSAAVKLTDGAVKGIDIAGSIRNAKAKLGTLRGEQTQQADKSQKTDFSELTGTFNIRNGVARNNDLSLKSPLLRVGGEGDVNLGEDTLNYLVKASIVGTTKGQGGREADELKGITVPVRVSGPLAAPSYKLDFGAMVTETAKQTVKSKLEERLLGGGAAKDSAAKDGTKPGGLRDTLKGLFGR
jgi:AsmA protein